MARCNVSPRRAGATALHRPQHHHLLPRDEHLLHAQQRVPGARPRSRTRCRCSPRSAVAHLGATGRALVRGRGDRPAGMGPGDGERARRRRLECLCCWWAAAAALPSALGSSRRCSWRRAVLPRASLGTWDKMQEHHGGDKDRQERLEIAPWRCCALLAAGVHVQIMNQLIGR
jgi:hypothetical protein